MWSMVGAEEFFHEGMAEQRQTIISEVYCFLVDILKGGFFWVIWASCQSPKLV